MSDSESELEESELKEIELTLELLQDKLKSRLNSLFGE